MVINGSAEYDYIVDVCQAYVERQTGQHHVDNSLESGTGITQAEWRSNEFKHAFSANESGLVRIGGF